MSRPAPLGPDRAPPGPVARLVRYGEPGLRQACRPAAPDDEGLAGLVEAMWLVMLRQRGVGLAAPQVGDDRRVIVVRDPRRPGRGGRLVFVNPVLRDFSGPSILMEEGCLSFPGLYLRVRRPRALTVDHLDETGRPRTLAADGMLARIVQHEADHLDGVLFIDHLSAWRRRLLWWRLRRLARPAARRRD